jgi:hypothetical protein
MILPKKDQFKNEFTVSDQSIPHNIPSCTFRKCLLYPPTSLNALEQTSHFTLRSSEN